MMLSTMSYSAAITGAAFLQIASPTTAEPASYGLPAEVLAASPAWSDRSYRFSFLSVLELPALIDEKQNETLHRALMASFDEIIPPKFI